MIRLDKVSKAYTAPAVKELDLEIHRGEFVTMIGSSGCGKTTALKLMNGLLTPDSGTVYVDGEDISGIDQIQLRRRIGYAIQGVGLFPHLNVEKNIAYVPSLSKGWEKQDVKSRALELLETVGLDGSFLERYPSELSGGQRQRIGLARALAAKPEILLMDEPFGAVDEINRRALQDALLEIHKELHVTIVFVTHDIKEAMKLGNRVLVMDEGQKVQLGTPDEIRSHPQSEFVRELVLG